MAGDGAELGGLLHARGRASALPVLREAFALSAVLPMGVRSSFGTEPIRVLVNEN